MLLSTSSRAAAAPDQLDSASPVAGPSRLVSLDVFRGLAVVGMILVNSAGDWQHYYVPISHAPWHGCRPGDLVFPSFLFIVGVSLVYALGGVKRQGGPLGPVLRRVARRAAVLILLGILLDLIPNFYFTSFRIPGILQRIGLVFFACSALFLTTTWRTQLWVLLGLLGGYNVLLQLVPVPGVGAANLEPATNLGAWLDRLVFTKRHLYQDQQGWDPEGLLSTLPAIGTGLLGVLAAQWLRRAAAPAVQTAWLFVAGTGLIVLGLIWDGWFPINKQLWTSSYVLYTGGIAAASLATLYWLCDVQARRRWAIPLLWFGSNAITAFFLSEVVDRLLHKIKLKNAAGQKFAVRDWLYEHLFTAHISNPYHASLAWALVYLAIWTLLLWWMYRRRIFIKV
ncbi:acyltransferase family protein [Hymenobacter sp. CRA2]|uniref:acyltransferase family protein n=1 Tax=Hymenobacter sp. CRA2 TaxID=1955620 RepID=UPI00098F3DA3|nr:heparan-alpha-glucosaminide N-acetyltransferase domain-containing protein [Hymenobacter sp. CRA2]